MSPAPSAQETDRMDRPIERDATADSIAALIAPFNKTGVAITEPPNDITCGAS